MRRLRVVAHAWQNWNSRLKKIKAARQARLVQRPSPRRGVSPPIEKQIDLLWLNNTHYHCSAFPCRDRTILIPISITWHYLSSAESGRAIGYTIKSADAFKFIFPSSHFLNRSKYPSRSVSSNHFFEKKNKIALSPKKNPPKDSLLSTTDSALHNPK